MTDLSTAPASNSDSPGDHDSADAIDVGETRAPTAGPPDTASSVLERLEQAGWRSLHGRTAPGRRLIDHIAIGPGGIFVIDSHALDATGADVQLASVPEAAIVASNQLADAVRQLVPPLTRQYVVPVLAYVASAPMSIARGPVQVCTTSMLQRVIASRTAALSSRDIEEVFAVLTAAFDGRGSVPQAAPAAPARESHHAAPKRRKLGWRGAHHSDDAADTAPAPATDPGPWPAVTPPPVWEPSVQAGPVVPPEPYIVPGAVADSETVGEAASFEHVDAEPIAQAVETAEAVDAAETGEAVGAVETVELEPSEIALAPAHAGWADVTENPPSDDDDIPAFQQTWPAPDPAADEPAGMEWPGSSDETDAGEAQAVHPIADVHVDADSAIDDAAHLIESDDSAAEIAADIAGSSHHVDADSIEAAEAYVVDEAEEDEEPTLPAPARDPLVGSFPVGWPGAGEPIHEQRSDDHDVIGLARVEEHGRELPEAADPAPFVVSPAAASASPWPTIQLPDLSAADEPDLGMESLALADIDDDPVQQVETDPLVAEEPEPIIELPAAIVPEAVPEPASMPASAPTPIGRTQPGGRRRAPSAPWHERLLPKARTKSERPEGGRRAAQRPQATVSEIDAPTPAAGSSGERRPAGSRRATTARPRTLSARIGAVSRAKDAPRPSATRRLKRSRSHSKDTGASFPATKPPSELSSRGQKMYAAMTARQAAGVESAADDEPTNVGAPIRRLITLGVAAGLLIVSGTHVTSISSWVADHVRLPGVEDTTGTNPKGGGDTPGRSANLESPGSHVTGDGGKLTKP